MHQKVLVFLFLAVVLRVPGWAQGGTVFTWYDPALAGHSMVEGQGWPGEVRDPYDRLPARAEPLVRKAVWDLSRQSAGLVVRFQSNAAQIRIRYAVKGNIAFPHMPATGVSGVDLYAAGMHGEWLWCGAQFTFGDTIEYRYSNLIPQEGREFCLYLPLYNTLKWMVIGVPDSASFHPLPRRSEKPIVVYGTSIAQGACASRPGMAWTAIVSRKLGVPVINLGFSGNGRLEEEVTGLVSEIDARLVVLDCLPNLVPSASLPPGDVKARIEASVQAIRKKGMVPILLVHHAGYSDGPTNPSRAKMVNDVNEMMDQAFKELTAGGVKEVYLLSRTAIGLEMDMMVDGTHPSDLGMQRYADGYEKCIRKIFRNVTGFPKRKS